MLQDIIPHVDKIDREYFYEGWRSHIGTLKQPVVDNVNILLEEFEDSLMFNTKSEIAYALATIKHETNNTFAPVVEGYWIPNNRVEVMYNWYRRNNPLALKTIFPNGKDGLNYLGRGYIQCTHSFNYKNLGNAIGVDLYNNPDEALQPSNAFKIMEYGMFKGSFTSHKMADYINDSHTDFFNARRIINGTDKADLIAGYAEKFYKIIKFN